MTLLKQEDLEKRIQILRAKGFEISPAMAHVIKHEINLALAERDREVMEKIEKLQKYTGGSSVEPKDMRVKLTDVINLITNK